MRDTIIPSTRLPVERLDTEHARFRIDLDRLLAPQDMVWKTLPSDWKCGAPIGNGDVGAMAYGHPREFAFAVGKSDVWDRRLDTRSFHPGESFAELRETYLNRQPGDAEKLGREMASNAPPAADATQTYKLYWERALERDQQRAHLTTCGTLRLHLDEGLNPEEPAMAVRLADGTMALTYGDRKATALVSREYDVLLFDMDRGTGVTDPPVVYECYDRFAPLEELPWEFVRPPLDENPLMEIVEDDGVYFATQRFKAGGHYTVALAAVGFRGHELASFRGRMMGRFRGPVDRSFQVYLAVVSSWDCNDTMGECRRRLERAIEDGPEKIRDAHAGWWRDYWLRGLASVGDVEVEKPYYRALYLEGSMLRPGCQSPGLQGVWCGENYPVWSADYHSNINIQCIYWGLFTNNRVDLMEPYFRLYDGMVENARAVARDYFRSRGLKFPHAGSIGGHDLSNTMAAPLATDPCESAWVAQLFWQYYEYTLDRAFLKDVAYPILRDVALFLADYLTRDAASGRWTIEPCVHFECHRGPMGMWGTNSLYAQAFFRIGLRQAIDASAELGVDETHRQEWQEKLDGLVDPPTHLDGYWKAWENGEPRYCCHNFMLPLVFPAELVSAFHGPKEWKAQADATWREIRAQGKSWCTGGPWCGGQGLAEIIRLGAVDAAFERARWAEDQPSGIKVNPGGGYGGSFIQVDHGPGMCRVLADMMLLASGGAIRLFPGIPKGVPARFASLRAPGGFLLTAEKRGDAVDYCLVMPTAATRLRLANPWSGRTACVTHAESGERVTATADPVIECDLDIGGTYVVVPEGFDPKALSQEDFAVARVPQP